MVALAEFGLMLPVPKLKNGSEKWGAQSRCELGVSILFTARTTPRTAALPGSRRDRIGINHRGLARAHLQA